MGSDSSQFTDSYKKGKQLGRGGFGKVIECTRKADDHKLAAKMMSIKDLTQK